MSLERILERDLISCSPEESIRDAAELMLEHDVGAVLVVEGEVPVGIVTDRDITLRCTAEGWDCAKKRVAEIMSKGVHTVTVDQGIFDVIQVMKVNEIRRVPVVDRDGRAVGLLSFGDVYQLVGQEISDLLGPTSPVFPKIVDRAA